jgi:hypothetical protein
MTCRSEKFLMMFTSLFALVLAQCGVTLVGGQHDAQRFLYSMVGIAGSNSGCPLFPESLFDYIVLRR